MTFIAFQLFTLGGVVACATFAAVVMWWRKPEIPFEQMMNVSLDLFQQPGDYLQPRFVLLFRVLVFLAATIFIAAGAAAVLAFIDAA